MEPTVPLSKRLASLAVDFQKGGQEAFLEIVGLMRDRLYALAARALRDRGAAEDLVQEALVKAYRNLGGLKDPATCEHWLYQITLNLVRDFARRRSLERRSLQAVAAEARSTQEDPPPAEEVPSALYRRILEAVDVLPGHHREVFVMREIQGMSHEAIARTLGIPEGTVWSRLSFARKSLQQKLRREVD